MPYKDLEKRLAYQREYEKNRRRSEEYKQWRKKYAKENKKRIRECQKKHQEMYPEKYRSATRKHMRKQAGAINPSGELKYGACEICKKETKLCYDHSHKTGEFRGWLCPKCNSALGLIHDNCGILISMFDYLTKTLYEKFPM